VFDFMDHCTEKSKKLVCTPLPKFLHLEKMETKRARMCGQLAFAPAYPHLT